MLSLGINLSSVGISAAKGIDLVAQREQLGATLPKTGGTVQQQQTEQESSQSSKLAATKRELTPEQQRQVAELQQIDRTVRAHEQAHISAGRGVVTSGANFSYTYGPDGRQYAVAGEVSIDTSPERKPEANIDKGQRIQAAALAPRDPSPQDYRVASVGAQLQATGQADLVRQQRDERMLQAEQARQKREAQQAHASDSDTAPTDEAAAGTGREQDLTRRRIETAYATVAAKPSEASRISLFA